MSYIDEFNGYGDNEFEYDNDDVYISKLERRRPDYHQIVIGYEQNVNKDNDLVIEPIYLKYFETAMVVGAKIKNAIDGGYYYDKNKVPFKIGSKFEQTLFKVRQCNNNQSAVLYYDTESQYHKHQATNSDMKCSNERSNM